MGKNYLLAIDSFKECLRSEEVAAAALEGILLVRAEAQVMSLPVSDGGEGMLTAFSHALGASQERVMVHDPFMRTVRAWYGISNDGTTAIIETAQAIGLDRLKPEERDPMRASSFGAGELIAEAYDRGCRTFIVGLGGSATCDGGEGMMQCLQHIPLSGCSFIIAADVDNPLYGPHGAAYVFAPQKGADEAMTEELDRRLQRYARRVAEDTGRDMSQVPGAGAAGGIAFALMSHYPTRITSGAELLLKLTDFDSLLERTDMVITGEGKADRQTLMGKLPYAIMSHSRARGIPTVLIAGKVEDKELLMEAGFHRVVCIHPEGTPPDIMMDPDTTREHIRRVMKQIVE